MAKTNKNLDDVFDEEGDAPLSVGRAFVTGRSTSAVAAKRSHALHSCKTPVGEAITPISDALRSKIREASVASLAKRSKRNGGSIVHKMEFRPSKTRNWVH